VLRRGVGQLGASLSVADIGTGSTVVQDYAQAAEGLGFDFLLLGDHVLSNNPTATRLYSANIGVSSDNASRIGTTATAFHVRLVRLSRLLHDQNRIRFWHSNSRAASGGVGCKTSGLLDELCGHLFRLGIGVGWNEIEFQGLGLVAVGQKNKCVLCRRSGRNRTQRSMASFTIWTMAASPCHAEATFHRVAKYGDGYMQLDYAPGEEALAAFAKLRALVRDAGRKPEDVGLEVWVSPGAGNEDEWRQEFTFWKNAGITHVTAHTTFISKHHRRVAGRSAAEHLAALARYRAAVADLL
jgi:hypothetical protein